MTFKGFIKVNIVRFIIINLLAVVSGFCFIFAGYVQMYWLTYIKNKSWTNFLISTAIMAVSWFFAQCVIYYLRYLNNVQEEEYFKKIRDQVAIHYFKDGKFHKIADFQNRVTNDFNLVKNNCFEWYLTISIYGSMFIFSLIALVTINWQIFLASVLLDLISYFLPQLAKKRLAKATKNLSVQNKQYLDTLEKWFAGVTEIKRYFAGLKLLKVESNASQKLENAQVEQTTAQQVLFILTGIASFISDIVLMTITGLFITKNLIIFGAIMSVENFAANISIGLQQVIQAISMIKSVRPLMQEISHDSEIIKENNVKNTATPATVATQNLALKFPNGESIHFPDIEIHQGEKILLTGDSGAGKSTLFKLILGAIKPSKGKIVFKDKTGNQINPDLTKIGYIPQDPNLFPGSIKENITMFNSKLDDKIEKVVEEVNFDKDIAKFKDNLDEKLDLDNLSISGGQRQKIVLARAKIHDADIILIDEGTSAIDQKATMSILQNLLKGKATIVFIAHNFNEGMRQLFDREIHLVKE